ncbi:MAG TPA: glycosyl hydrolase family 39 [Terriglobales bacterium]|nr:glycosyl hydrolase family 39 [Terriglobales bacterium]
MSVRRLILVNLRCCPTLSSYLLAILLCTVTGHTQAAPSQPQTIIIDAAAPTHPFPHFWEHMFGSGRAVLSLRESYRNDLKSVKQITDVEYIRFHGVFLDEMGVYDEDSHGNPVYNFSYVDQVYDGLLQNGVRPFVELSFMPTKLAAQELLQSFWYKPNVAPPKDFRKWDDLITAFTRHLVERYGSDEVAKWYFEVWNEPNLDFWAGEPKQPTYWELYDHTAADIKRVNSHLRVGGPATAQAAWVDAFIRHCVEHHVPVDFVSTHVYGNDPPEPVLGTKDNVPRNRMVCRAVSKVHDQIKASPLPNIPLLWTEFNASYKNEPEVTDSAYMGPWLADTIRQCDGLVNEMSYWTFSDVFEEQGVVKEPFYGGFGLIAAGSIPKPSYNAFRLLHRLGEERITVNSDTAVATRGKGGSLVLAVWDLVNPGDSGTARNLVLKFEHLGKARHAYISRADAEHGDVHSAYVKMGSPRYPTQAQLGQLRQASELPPPEKQDLKDGELIVSLPVNGLALIEIK